MLESKPGIRSQYDLFHQLFSALTPAEFEAKRQAVDTAFLRQGVTFNVYGDAAGAEKIFPFLLLPRILPAKEWGHLARGLAPPITALKLFLPDNHYDQKNFDDGVSPEIFVFSS